VCGGTDLEAVRMTTDDVISIIAIVACLLGYELKAIAAPANTRRERTGERSDLVTFGRGEEWRPGERKYHNLRHGGTGLISARETALEDLTGSVKKVLKKKSLPLGNNHPLGVEYVEEQLRTLRLRASQGWVPEEFKELSLRRSLQDVLKVIDRYLEEYSAPVTRSRSYRQDPLQCGQPKLPL
jgi:hypothetical protein